MAGMGAGARRNSLAFSELSKAIGETCKLEVGQDSAFTGSCAGLGSTRKTQRAERRSWPNVLGCNKELFLLGDERCEKLECGVDVEKAK